MARMQLVQTQLCRFFYIWQVFAKAVCQSSGCFSYVDLLAQRVGYAIYDISGDVCKLCRSISWARCLPVVTTLLIKPDFCFTLAPVQHHSFFTNQKSISSGLFLLSLVSLSFCGCVFPFQTKIGIVIFILPIIKYTMEKTKAKLIARLRRLDEFNLLPSKWCNRH